MALRNSPRSYLETTARALVLAVVANSVGCVKAPEDQPEIEGERVTADNQTCIDSAEIEDYISPHLEFSFEKNHDGVPINNEGQFIYNTDGTAAAADGIYPLQVAYRNGDEFTLVPVGALPEKHYSYTAHIGSSDTLAESQLEDSPNLDCVGSTNESGGSLEAVNWDDTNTEDGIHFRWSMNTDYRCAEACKALNGDESGSSSNGNTTDGETDSSTGMIPDMPEENPCGPGEIFGGSFKDGKPDFTGEGEPACTPYMMYHKNEWQDTCGDNSVLEDPEECQLVLDKIYLPLEEKGWDPVPPEDTMADLQPIAENSAAVESSNPGAILVSDAYLEQQVGEPVDGGKVDIHHFDPKVPDRTITITYSPDPTN